MTEPLPAAEYLRVSTEQQRYSLDSQRKCIREFAEISGFRIVRSYVDVGRSGLNIKARQGLSTLISDVLSADLEYSAIFVYDVSRWGRFQDIDEAAHYEFLCRKAGAPVVYCADTGVNPAGECSSILKALRRVMAAEFSRELSAKVFASQKRSAEAGFKVGSCPFGYRRLLVSADGKTGRSLEPKELKPRTSERVVLVAGPEKEVCCVKAIFALAAEGKRPTELERIAAEKGWTRDGRPLLRGGIDYMLKNPVYKGDMVWNRQSTKLHSRVTKNPRDQWIMVSGAVERLVDNDTFEKAQSAPPYRNTNTDDEVLEQLRLLIKDHGALSQQIIKRAWRRGKASEPGVYYRRFGGLTKAYELLGYTPAEQARSVLGWKRAQFRDRFIRNIVDLLPDHFAIHSLRGRRRFMLQMDHEACASVRICYRRPDRNNPTWRLTSVVQEDPFPTLVALMNDHGSDVESCYLLPRVRSSCLHDFTLQTKWFRPAIRLANPSELYPRLKSLVEEMSHA